MKKELDEALCKDFPNLYRQRNGDLMSTAMCWGFECGAGWEPLIRNLSKDIEAEILKLPKENREYVCASQVKEKYGTLRFYMHSETDEMSWLISEAENKSATTCELCGKNGKIRGDGWITVRCDDCQLNNYLHRFLDVKDENIKGIIEDLKKIFNPEKEKRTLKEIKDSIISTIDWKWYKLTSNIKHPIWFLQDIKRAIKYRIWKIRRLLK